MVLVLSVERKKNTGGGLISKSVAQRRYYIKSYM